MAKPIKSAKFNWRGTELFYGDRKVGGIVGSPDTAIMWCVRMPDDSLSDHMNLTRARDTAQAIAATQLRGARRLQQRHTAVFSAAGAVT